MKFKYILICVLTISLLVSCKSKKRTAQKSKQQNKEVAVSKEKVTPKKTTKSPITNATIAYIEKYKETAMEEMRKFKIPASIKLAQGILESSSGRSQLTQRSNNHFGIKCHKGWKGKRTYHDDDEKGECFRVYKNPNTSFRDHSLFLTGRQRYAKLFKLKKDDYVGWAKGLSAAGYATDRRYPAKLIAIIEKYNLYKYDAQVLGKRYKKQKIEETINSQKTHIVVKGDTLYSISKKYGITVEELKKINKLRSNNIYIGQTLILIK